MSQPLAYAYIEDDAAASSVPPRAVNGGLYTGAPAAPGAPWGNVPIVPEPHIMAKALVQYAGASERAAVMMPTYPRPGNNPVQLDGYQPFDEKLYPTMMCIRD
jgi:hypothetical protein